MFIGIRMKQNLSSFNFITKIINMKIVKNVFLFGWIELQTFIHMREMLWLI